MLVDIAPDTIDAYTPPDKRAQRMCAAGGAVIGHSEQGRPIHGIVIGNGPRKVSLISGNHSDEPVGSETLLRVIGALTGPEAALRCASAWTFVIVPHCNPDGEARQRAWLDAWPDALACLTHEFRERPGRDVEFGYPDMRIENRVVADFLAEHGPYDMHLSLHGMTAGEGGYHLIERSWLDRTGGFREAYARAMTDAGLVLFDWDRGGEKGFDYIGPGFATTPRSDAMREHFESLGDRDTASKFHLNSMEYVRTLGGDPLCMVTELPLFVVGRTDGTSSTTPGVPGVYLGFRRAVHTARAAMADDDLDGMVSAMSGYTVEPLPIATAVRLQWKAIELGLEAIA